MTPEEIRQLLARKNLKVTPQRAVIMDFLLNTDTHPTADEIFEAVKNGLHGLSRGTLYNVLSALVDANIVHPIAIEPGVIRYDANVSSHHHFIDVRTGDVYDIPWEKVQPLFGTLGDEYNVADYRVNFYGVKPRKIPVSKSQA